MLKESLVFSVMKEIGLDVLENNVLCDQDLVVYTLKDRRSNIQNHINTYGFNLLEDCKLMELLFQYFLEKIYILENEYYPIYYIVDGDIANKKALEIKNNYKTLRSGFYGKDSLRFMDLIFKLNGNMYVDLSHFDK